MPDILVQCHLGTLRPVDEAGRVALGKKHGKTLKVTYSEPRNLAFHNKFFKMLDIILQNQDHYQNIEQLLFVCKLGIGHADYVQTRQGVVGIPKSISFAKMDADEFQAFYDKAVNWMISEVIPGLARKDLDAEVEQELLRF
jgi:hypothetical protein